VSVLPIERATRDIEQFDSGGSAVLSVYLDTEPASAAARKLEEEVGALLAPLRASLADDQGAALQLARAANEILAALGSLESIPRGVAAFACPDGGFVRVVPLPESVGRSAHFGEHFQLTPLLAALDEHEKTVVALVDREHARVFRVFLGQIEEVAQLEDGGRRHAASGRATLKSGAGPSAIRMSYGERNIERRDQWHVRQHLERALTAMRPNGDRVLVGGALETVHELIRLLPKRVRHRTRVIAGLPVDATLATVLERVLQTEHAAEREEEEELIDNLTERDRSRSVFGVTAVAEAVSDDRVHTLAYGSTRTPIAGTQCRQCGWLTPGTDQPACGRCGGTLERCSDLVERLVTRVHGSGGRVEEVRGPAQKMLLRQEGLAALLRYVPKSFPTPPQEQRKVGNGSHVEQ
jgi:hypothetical protein